MKFRGPIFFLPLAFFLCTSMVSIFRYLSAPVFSEKDIQSYSAVVINSGDDNTIEAEGICGKDTLVFRGEKAGVKSGQEITLYALPQFGIIKSNKEEILELENIKSRAKWFSILSIIGLIGVFILLYKTTQKQIRG